LYELAKYNAGFQARFHKVPMGELKRSPGPLAAIRGGEERGRKRGNGKKAGEMMEGEGGEGRGTQGRRRGGKGRRAGEEREGNGMELVEQSTVCQRLR